MRAHLRGNVVGYVALFLALTATATALPGRNSVNSGDIKDGKVKGKDLAVAAVTAPKLAPGSVGSAAIAPGAVGAGQIAPNSVGTGQVAADAVGFSEIDATAFNADIQEQGAFFGIPNDGIQGFEVEDGTLSAADFAGRIVRAGGDAACCTVRGGVLHTEDPFSESDPGTSFDLGAFELRSTAAGDPDKFQLCNPPGGVNFAAADTLYVGGSPTSTAETRSRTGLPDPGTCRTIDVNGGTSTSGIGDFRLYVPERAWETIMVQGVSFGTGTGFTIVATSVH